MTWMRMPLFVWAIYTYAWLLIAVLLVIGAALTMLLLDRQAGTHFFLPDEGGNAILYQHMFWFFGHPEVYIMILARLGIVSEVLPVRAQADLRLPRDRVLDDRDRVRLDARLGALHVHGRHDERAQRLLYDRLGPRRGPDRRQGDQLARNPRHLYPATPMLFALGLDLIFTIGGLTGVMIAAFLFDWQVHDTYFIVAHMHYVPFRRRCLRDLSRGSTTGGRRCSAGCSASRSASGTSGSSSSG